MSMHTRTSLCVDGMYEACECMCVYVCVCAENGRRGVLAFQELTFRSDYYK
jgi:hypothetical protein